MKAVTADTLEHLIVAAMASDDWATVNDLEARLHALTPHREPPLIASSALWYAGQGLKVFPLKPHSKLPYSGSRGSKDATDDPERIREWWRRFPDSNVAIATGHLVDVIDIDGPQGMISWARTTDMPDAIGIVTTPRGGSSHLYIKTLGLKNGAKLFPGIDIRGQGGYVVAPPSIHPNSGIYKWRHPLDFNRVIPPLNGPTHDDNLCPQCGHPLDVKPHPTHYLAG